MENKTCVSCEKVSRLKKALSDLIGSPEKEDLKGMKIVLKLMPDTEEEKIAILNAINLLIELYE